MATNDSGVGLCISGDSAVVTGPKDLVESILNDLDVCTVSASKLGQCTADLAALASGVAATASSMDGRWFKMTAESHSRLAQLANFISPQNGLVSGVLRTDKGKIDSFLNFQRSGGINPAAMSNIATLTAALAVRAAVEQVEQLVQEMDVKLDQLLQDNRAEALGNLQGMTQILSRTYEIYEETGRVSDTAWDQIAGHATALAQTTSHCMRHIESMTTSLKSKSLGDRADAAQHIADGELRLWLAILAASHANQKRLETLELARLEREDEATVEVHKAANAKAAELQASLVTHQIGAFLDALRSCAEVSDFDRVRSPQKSRNLLDAVEDSVALVSRFGEIYGLDDLQLADAERAAGAKVVPSSAAKVGSFVRTKGSEALNANRPPSRTRSMRRKNNEDERKSIDGSSTDVTTSEYFFEASLATTHRKVLNRI